MARQPIRPRAPLERSLNRNRAPGACAILPPMGLDNPLHILILLVVVLLVFGAKRLPEIGRSLGEGMRGFKDSISGDTNQSLSQAPQAAPVAAPTVVAAAPAAPAPPVGPPVPLQEPAAPTPAG
jgi:sec-independent protein translocase protein TatA